MRDAERRAAYAALPFIGEDTLWAVEPTGDGAFDAAFGRECAAALVDFIRRTGDGAILSSVMNDAYGAPPSPARLAFVEAIGDTLTG